MASKPLAAATDDLECFTVKELAELWGVSDRTVYEQIRRKHLSAFQLPTGSIRVPKAAAREFMARNTIPTAAPAETGQEEAESAE